MDTEPMSAIFEDLLARDGILVYKTSGMSMEPMLRQDRDVVIIKVPSGRLRKNDVALYKRGRNYVLHRVIEVREGVYGVRGDNTYAMEIVPDSAVIGVLTSFRRKGKEYAVTGKGYRWYVRFWNAIYPLRLCRFRAVSLMKAIFRRLGITQFIKRLIRHA